MNPRDWVAREAWPLAWALTGVVSAVGAVVGVVAGSWYAAVAWAVAGLAALSAAASGSALVHIQTELTAWGEDARHRAEAAWDEGPDEDPPGFHWRG